MAKKPLNSIDMHVGSRIRMRRMVLGSNLVACTTGRSAGLAPLRMSFTIFSIGIHSKDSMPTEALVKFLTTPAAAAVIKVKGLKPL
jgi:hypothetical protein